MLTICVDGVTRQATYEKDNEHKQFRCTHQNIENAEAAYDYLNVTISSSENKDQLRERWFALRGDVALYDELRISGIPWNRAEAAALERHFESIPTGALTTVTYVSEDAPPSHTVKNSSLYRELRTCHALIVADLFGWNRDEIVMLQIPAESELPPVPEDPIWERDW